MDEHQRLSALRAVLQRLTHFAGYAAALTEHATQIELTAIALEELAQGDDDIMAVGQVLRETAAALRANAETLAGKVQSAIDRLSDNPTAGDIEAALVDLNAANETLTGAGSLADTIDPDAGGGVVDDGSGGVVDA